MRMAFGLVSVLVTLGIIILVMSMMLDKETGSIPVALEAREEAKQIAGVGKDGEAATQSAFFEEDTAGGKLRRLTTLRVVPGGAYDTYFGLQQGDEIVEIEQFGSMTKIRDMGDAGLAEAAVSDAYARNQHIIVNRDGQRLTLPPPPGTVVAAPTAPNAGAPVTAPTAPGNTGDAPADNRSPLSRQLDVIKGAGN